MATEIVEIICLVLLSTVVKILIFILCIIKLKQNDFFPEQNDFSLVTNINKVLESPPEKHAKNSARRLIKPTDTESSISVTEEEITDAELEIQHASQELRGNYKIDHCKDLASPPEKLIAGVLGISCLVLICIIVIFFFVPIELKRNNNFTVTNILKEYNCGPCRKEWFSYFNSCYYFSEEKKPWSESVTVCQSKKSQLLYIDTVEEMQLLNFLNALSWVGVYRNESTQPWKLENGSTSHLSIRESPSGKYNCVMIRTDYYTEKCEEPNTFYCKYNLYI